RYHNHIGPAKTLELVGCQGMPQVSQVHEAQPTRAENKDAVLNGALLWFHTAGIAGDIKHANIPKHQRQFVPALLTREAPQQPRIAGEPTDIAMRNVEVTDRAGIWSLAERIKRVRVCQNAGPGRGGQQEAGMA